MPHDNLIPGQYQIGSVVFGESTVFKVESFDSVGGYDVNVQDFQSLLSDEMQFGSDTLKPMPIQLKIHALHNYVLPNIMSLTNDQRDIDFSTEKQVGEFIREWRADDVRSQWGALKPLYICRDDGRIVRMYGRPGKIAVNRLPHKGQARDITAEFRRSDTLVYSDYEWFLNIKPGEITTVYRAHELDMGNGPSWFRFFLIGPMKYPSISVGNLVIDLTEDIDTGQVVEISAYPWERRVINLSDGRSLAASLTQPYLNTLNFPADTAVEVSWIATDTNTSTAEVDFASTYSAGQWTTVYSESGSGTMGVSNGMARWSDAGNGSRTGVMVYSHEPTISNYQLVGMTMPNPMEASLLGSEECSNRIIGRSNAAGTIYLYWDITYTHVWFGYHFDGQDHVLSQKFPITTQLMILSRILGDAFSSVFGILGAPVENWKYEAEFGNGAGEKGSTLRVNGHTFVSAIPETPLSYPGQSVLPVILPDLSSTNNRYAGIGMRATPRFTGQSTPGTVSEFWMRDNPPPNVAATLNQSAVIMLWRDSWHSP